MGRTRLYLCCVVAASSVISGPQGALAVNGDTCGTALTVQQGVTVNGNLTSFADEYSIPAACIGSEAAGVDTYYSLSTNAGYRYDIAVKPGSRLDVAAAVWDDCTLSENPCVDGSDAGGNGIQESLTIEPATDRNYIIQVLGVNAQSGATSISYAMKVTATPIPGDTGPADDVQIVSDIASVTDAADEDLSGHEDNMGGGCGQGGSPSIMTVFLLLAALVFVRRMRSSAL